MPTIKLGTFTKANFNQNLNLVTIDSGYVSPKNSIVAYTVMESTTAFTAPSATFFQGLVGNASNIGSYGGGADVGNITSYVQIAGVLDSFTTDTPINITLISDVPLNTLTDGIMDVYAVIITLDNFTQLSNGNSTFLVTKDCWLNGLCIIGTIGDTFRIGTTANGTDIMPDFTLNSTGQESFNFGKYFSESNDTTIYVSTVSINDYKLKLAIK